VNESTLWLELLPEECGVSPSASLAIEKEANEPMAIMTTMTNKTKNRNREIRKHK